MAPLNIMVPSSPDMFLWKFSSHRQSSGSIGERSHVLPINGYKDNQTVSSHLCAGLALKLPCGPFMLLFRGRLSFFLKQRCL